MSLAAPMAILAISTISMMGGVTARAQGGAPAKASRAADKERARELTREATLHYKLGEYEEALASYKEAFRVVQAPSLLFNIGQCQRLLGHNSDAVRSYKWYLRELPEAENRAEVERLIAGLQASGGGAEGAPRSQASARPQARPQPVADPAPSVAEPAVKPEVLAPPVVATPQAVEATADPERREQSSRTPWWLWGGAAAALAVGVVAVVVLSAGTKTNFPSADTSAGTFRF